jgi:hypothetical protein
LLLILKSIIPDLNAIWFLYEKVNVDIESEYSEAVQHLARLMARHFLTTAKQKQHYIFSRDYENEIQKILDWFQAEGHLHNLPDKKSTWLSLKRRSDKWHEEVWQRKVAEGANIAWESVLGEITLDGIKITPLISSQEVYREGCEMRNCVSSYVSRCVKNGFRLFSLTEPNEKRSTLSLTPKNGGFVIDQHQGPSNGRVSRAAAKAAREICRLYTQKYLETAAAA